jgi:hypothetical protein
MIDEPVQFLRELAEHYDFTDINSKNFAGSSNDARTGPGIVAPESFERFTQFIAESYFGWTDLLCIPRRPQRSRKLVAAVIKE